MYGDSPLGQKLLEMTETPLMLKPLWNERVGKLGRHAPASPRCRKETWRPVRDRVRSCPKTPCRTSGTLAAVSPEHSRGFPLQASSIKTEPILARCRDLPRPQQAVRCPPLPHPGPSAARSSCGPGLQALRGEADHLAQRTQTIASCRTGPCTSDSEPRCTRARSPTPASR